MFNIRDVNLKKYRFVFEDRQDFQRLLFFQYCKTYNIPCLESKNIKRKELKENDIPFGTVSWTENLLGKNIKPEYFPWFLKYLVRRRIWTTDNADIYDCDIFIKPADKYKRFDGYIHHLFYKNTKFSGPFICSDVTCFENEWRCYVAGGEIIKISWYKGVYDLVCAPPNLDLTFPKNYCGIVDIGVTTGDKELQLVEACHPYSFGWYSHSNDKDLGLKFIVCGWEYMRRLIKNENV